MILLSNELDETTRYRMKSKDTFTNDFYISLLLVIGIFMLGFLAGNVAHDKTFHPIHSTDIELR